MRKVFATIFSLLLCVGIMAQETTTVEVKGVGLTREDALQDALRTAVGQAVGVAVSSQTQVENYMVLSDAISTKTEGYIASYSIVKETPMKDRFEITVKAVVSMAPLKADVNLMAKTIGGIRFLVMFDPRKVKSEDIEVYNFAVERINEALSNRKYRYIEKTRFDELNKEAQRIFQESKDASEEIYVQQLGFKADAQFIIKISNISISERSEAFDTRTASKVTIELKAYDNCTAEGLGTIILESDWSSGKDAKTTKNSGVTSAITTNIDKLFKVFNTYIGDWVNNGTPYELRFYASGTYRDFRDLRTKLKSDNNFGGQMEIVSFDNYSKLNCTFRKKPDELADKILDYADQIPFFASKEMDVRLIYGRQISFAPRKEKVPELDNINNQQTEPKDETTTPPKTTTQPKETGKTPNKTTKPAVKTTKPAVKTTKPPVKTTTKSK